MRHLVHSSDRKLLDTSSQLSHSTSQKCWTTLSCFPTHLASCLFLKNSAGVKSEQEELTSHSPPLSVSAENRGFFEGLITKFSKTAANSPLI